MNIHRMYLLLYVMIYQILQIIALPFVVLYFLRRKWQGKDLFGNLWQRLGYIAYAPQHKEVIWLHAVSVGEMLAIQELVIKIKEKNPDYHIYITTGTNAGYKIAREQIAADQVSFIPFDFLVPMLAAFNRINPKKIIIMEAELWPMFLIIASYKKIPCYLVNGRIQRSFLFKNRLTKFFAYHLLRLFTNIYAQTADEKKGYESLGLSPETIFEFGDIKSFNVFIKKNNLPEPLKAIHPTYPTLLVGSLHPAEAPIYLSLFRQVKATYPQAKLILAPRHFHWKAGLLEQVTALNLSYLMIDKSTMELNSELVERYDVILVCTIGKLFTVYPYASIFFLGGTFVPIGGHNLLEPAVWSKLTFVGPWHSNSQKIADELEDLGGLIKINNSEELTIKVLDILAQEDDIRIRGQQAGAWLTQEAEVVTRNVTSLLTRW